MELDKPFTELSRHFSSMSSFETKSISASVNKQEKSFEGVIYGMSTTISKSVTQKQFTSELYLRTSEFKGVPYFLFSFLTDIIVLLIAEKLRAAKKHSHTKTIISDELFLTKILVAHMRRVT